MIAPPSQALKHCLMAAFFLPPLVFPANGEVSRVRAVAGNSPPATISITHGAGLGSSGGSEPDGDGDGMSDSWESSHGLDPTIDDGGRDEEPDGLTNLEESERKTDPHNPDSDEDDLGDALDAMPTESVMKVPAAPEVQYAIIDLGSEFSPAGINDSSHVLLVKDGPQAGLQTAALWLSGTTRPIGEGMAGSFRGPLQSGEVFFGSPVYEFVTTGSSRSVSFNFRWTATSSLAAQSVYQETKTVAANIPIPLPSLPPLTNGVLATEALNTENSLWTQMRNSVNPLNLEPSATGTGAQASVASLTWINDARDHSFESETTFVQPTIRTVGGTQGGTEDLTIQTKLSGHQATPSAFSSSFGYTIYSRGSPLPQPSPHPQNYRDNSGLTRVGEFPTGPAVITYFSGSTVLKTLPGAESLIDLNNKLTGNTEGPYFLGTSEGGNPTLWCYNSGTFAQAIIGGAAPASANASRVVSRMLSNYLVAPQGNGIWRNGRFLDVARLCGSKAEEYVDWSIFQVSPARHNLLANATNSSDGLTHSLLLVPVDMAVDANRDGTIKFAGNFHDPATLGKPLDKTEEGRPFRFWCNDDDDGDSGGGAEDPDSNQKDSRDNEIKTTRDLEDFTRLHLNIGGLQDAIVAGTITVGLEWRNPSGYPAIKIYRAAETNGGDQYLQTELGAGQQALGAPAISVGTVSRGDSYKFPASFWQADPLSGLPALSASSPNRFLLFEGVTEGKGELVLTFWKGTEKIGEGPGVWLDLVDIKKMYVRSDGNQFVPPGAPENDDTIIFVHGWRMSPNGRSAFAESFYKRLWHRGFKGRFAAFQWETHWNADNHFWAQYIGPIDAYLSRYNDSEYIAWNSAAALKAFVNGLPGARKHIAAHSMGNIVTSEAIRLGMGVNNYALMQAAVPSACYDPDPRTRQTTTYNHFTFTMWDKQTPDDDPDPATRALAYRGRFSNLGVNLVSFYLERDYATFMPWEVNNDQTKPEGGSLAANFRYLRNNPNGQKLYKYTSVFPALELFDYYLTNPYEAMTYACSTWGKAVGAQNIAEGALTPANNVDLSGAGFALPGESFSGFGDEHSGQFNANIHYLKPFYDTLINKLEIGPPNP